MEALQDATGSWVYDEQAIHSLLVLHFSTLFQSLPSYDSMLLSVSTYPSIDAGDLLLLGADPTYEEVRKALFSMASYKAPGPDGFHPIFFKSKWEVVGQDVFNFVASVFENPSLIGNVNHTLLTLIPKLDDPKTAADFRSIALCNVIYKVVTKVLTNRIRLVLPHIIAGSQSSFIQGRNTKDNSIVLQEAVHTMQGMTGRKRFMIIKLDLAKAYDKLEWRFVLESLEILNFPKNIVELNKACLVSSSMAINWQGCASDPFFPTRGLRQGDPLSPLLFVIALERLSHCIMDAVNQGLRKPLKFGRGGPSVSHLMFADDILLISEATPDNTTTIIDILDRFGARSGQQVNKQKSRVFFSNNTPQHIQQSAGHCPYLGPGPLSWHAHPLGQKGTS